MFLLPQGLFECCSAASSGKPEFLERKLVSARPATNLLSGSRGSLDLFYQRWPCEGRQPLRALIFIHPGETEHAAWYNGLAVRLASSGCSVLCCDGQGFGQSDGCRGYFESFLEVKEDFLHFVRRKWAECPAPRLIFIAKGFGALLLMRALPELQAMARESHTVPLVVLISPGFQFNSFVEESASCGLQARCTQPACSQALAGAPEGQRLEYMSRWFPKMLVTEPLTPDLICRDPQAMERMTRDALIWRQGYRARVLAEILQEQSELREAMRREPPRCPALILHGSGDKLYTSQGSEMIHRLWCQGSSGNFPLLKIYQGAYHQLLSEPNKDEVIGDILAFVLSGI